MSVNVFEMSLRNKKSLSIEKKCIKIFVEPKKLPTFALAFENKTFSLKNTNKFE